MSSPWHLGNYLVIGIFFLMTLWWGISSDVLSNAAVSMVLLQLHMYHCVNKSGFFKHVWQGCAWTMWFWYSETGEKRQSSWNFLFPRSSVGVLACSCANTVTRPTWSIIYQITTVTIGYVTTSSFSDGNAGLAQNNAKKHYCWYHSETGILLFQRWNWPQQLHQSIMLREGE